MSTAELRAIRSFRADFARRQAARVLPVAGGFAVLDEEFHRSHEHNQLIVEGAAEPESLPEAAEVTLGHLTYRRITVHDDALGQACAPVLERAGYVHAVEVVMVHTGPAPVAGAAEPVQLSALRPALERQLRVWMPAADDQVIDHLVARRAARLRGAEQVLFLAVRDEEGSVGSWADLYVDRTQGIAQIEDLVTADEHTRRGLGDAVLATALHRAAAEGCRLRFLLADAEDWPQHWYARRGFTAIERSHSFTRH